MNYDEVEEFPYTHASLVDALAAFPLSKIFFKSRATDQTLNRDCLNNTLQHGVYESLDRD